MSADQRLVVEVSRKKTANGGDEWNLLVGGVAAIKPVGIFTDPGKSEAEMLPMLLHRAVFEIERVGPRPLRED